MSEHVLKQDTRLNDSMERSIMNSALSNGETVSIVTLGKNILTFIKQKSLAIFNFLAELSDEIYEVRAEAERYSRTRW